MPIAAKILERLIPAHADFTHVCKVIDLHDHQGAYQCSRSSNEILLFAVDNIFNALNHSSVVCAAFLNLPKAFNSLDHAILLKRIQELGVYSVELQ